MQNDLLEYTSRYFDSINFSEINESWIDNVFDNEFATVEENQMSIGVLFVDDPADTLWNVCRICEAWIKKGSDIDSDGNMSATGNMSSRPEEGLWTYLNEMDITIRQILATIYLLCSKAVKTAASVEERELGLLSSKWYFCSLMVHGSSAYSVFNSNLFRICMDCFQLPDHTESKKSSFAWKDFGTVQLVYIGAIESLIPLLSVCHLGTDTTTLDHVILRLSELTSCSIGNVKLNFDINFMELSKQERLRYTPTTILACLAFQGLTTLFQTELNADRDYTYSVILHSLNKHVLCVRVNKTLSTIPVKFLNVKENAVSYFLHNLTRDVEGCSHVTSTSLRRLCLSYTDKNIFRDVVARTVSSLMFHLKVQDLAEMVQWLLLLADCSEMNHRAFACQVLGFILDDISQVDKEGLPEGMEIYLSPVPLMFAILTRCDDVFPTARARALTVTSHNMEVMLKTLSSYQEPSQLPMEDFDDELEFLKLNGEHRRFWYYFETMKAVVDEIINILHRRIEDDNGKVRKAALTALGSLIVVEQEFLTEDNMKHFIVAAKDQNLSNRKQLVKSLTPILNTYPNSDLAQNYWIKCILPLVQDPEGGVTEEVAIAMEEKFLSNVLSADSMERDAAFGLLRKLTHGEFLSHQRYLQKAFHSFQKDKKMTLKPQMVKPLEKLFGSGNDELIWFYLSIFSAHSKLPSTLSQLAVQEFHNLSNWSNNMFMEYILKVISNARRDLPSQDVKLIEGALLDKIKNFSASVELIPLMVELLGKLSKLLKTEKEFADFATEIVHTSMNGLTLFVSRKKVEHLPPDELSIKYFVVLKEFCHLFPVCITSNLCVLLKSFVYPRSNANAHNQVSVVLKGHAYAALGKIALQDESLAKELLPLLSRALLTSEHDMIRNNVVLILIEMCKRYTSYADKYLPVISNCFRDRRYIIRFQAVTLLISLLQEGYIKWRGSLLFCLLFTLLDKKESIQELGKYCLVQLLFAKKPSIFADNFIDCLYVFNCFAPPGNQLLVEQVKEMNQFALFGEENRDRRMHIYRFMLTYMMPLARGYVINLMCGEMLPSVAEGVYPLNTAVKSMVRDIMAVLTSKEIRAVNVEKVVNENEEVDEEGLTKLEYEGRRLVLVAPAVEAMISLKNCVLECKSDLLDDIVFFLKEILQDYKGDVEEMLKGDKMLRLQVLNEMRRDTLQQEKEAKRKKDARKEANRSPPSRNQLAEEARQTSAFLMRAGRESLCPNEGPSTSGLQNGRSLRLVCQSSKKAPLDKDAEATGRDSPCPNDVPSTSGVQNGVVLPLGCSTPQKNRSRAHRDDPQPPAQKRSKVLHVDEIPFASTPRVVMKPLKIDLPNISKISLRGCTMNEEDDDDEML